MKKYTQEELNKILDLHKKWLEGDSNGVKADLSKADLSKADLSKADLSEASLSKANLSKANLYGASLSKANLSKANLYGADLSKANLYGANLSKADLSRADLSEASLSKANLSKANLYGAEFDDKLLVINHPIYTIQIKGKKWIKVGCQEHSYEEWLNFTDGEIQDMAENALDFYPILIKYLKATFE